MNEFGIRQVEQAAEVISSQRWDLVLSSPLGRAKQSAEIVARRLGIESVTEHELLLERAFGIGEGMLYQEWNSKYAQLDNIPGVESTAEVTNRASKLLDHIESEFSGKKVLAVSHGALIRFLLQVVTNGAIPPKGERLENASLHVIRKADSWSLDAWSPKPLGS
jgi:broad specificity phosphatase PhoE